MRRYPLILLLVLGALLVFTACATIGPPQPPSLELSKPPLDLRAVRKGDHVTLTWTIPSVTTDRQRARSLGTTRICRAADANLTQCGPPIGQASPSASLSSSKTSNPKSTGSYIDTLPIQSDDPADFFTYAVEVCNADGRSAGLSNHVRVSSIRTLPPPQNFRASVTKQGVVLNWTNDIQQAGTQQKAGYVYRVYRRLEDDAQRVLIGQVPVRGEHEENLTDSSIEWEKTYEYRAETVTVITRNGSEEQVEGDDSPEIRVFADDVFPPAVPSGLQAVFSGPGQKAFVDLVWAPDTDIDLAGYNVYRHEEGAAPLKINKELVKTPAYRDTDVVPGKHYFYSVSAVDVRGNESALSEEAEESVLTGNS
jgi:hypothetical protein